MKYKRHLSVLIILAVIALFMRCDCNPEDSERLPLGIGFSLISPADEAFIQTQNVYFEWSWIMFYPRRIDAMYLRIKPDTASIFTEIPMALIYREHDTVFQSTYDIDTLEPSTTYYWNVRADVEFYEDSITTMYSSTKSFTMAEYFVEPGDIHNPTPDSAAIGVGLNPEYSWEIYNPDLIPYDFDIYLGTTGDPPLLAAGLAVPYYSLINDTLDYHTLYYWRIEAYHDTDTLEGPLWEFTTDYRPEDDIFALFEIDVRQTPTGYHIQEEFRARFDTGLALNEPIKPLQADSVLIEGIKLDWIAAGQHYSQIVFSEPVIENGLPNNIRVYGNSSVPNLNTNATSPACTLSIISPESFEMVPISGFEVTWDDGDCGGNVWLTLMDGANSTGVSKEVINDGLDSLTAADLAPLEGQTGSYDLYLIRRTEENLDAVGYRPESLIRFRIINRMLQISITSR